MSLSFKERLDIAWKQGEFAHAWARFIVHHDITLFSEITLKPDFDIALMWDEKLIEQHVESQRKQPR